MGGGGVELAFAIDNQVVRLLDAVPAVIAVHGEVATDQARNAAFAEVFEGLVQQLNRRGRAFGRGVAAIQERVQVDLFGAALERQFGHGHQVVLMAMHATVGQQAHDVHGLALGNSLVDRRAKGRVFEELAIADRFGDTGEVLIHHAASAQVHVANLGVAHLPVRQADIHA